MILRGYQLTDVERLRAAHRQGHRRVCYCLPTGGGKTIIFVEIIRRALERGSRIAILVHRQELIDQTERALIAAGIEFGFVAAGYPETPGADVLLCMVQTLTRRHGRLGGIELIVVDEVHHVVAKSYAAILAQAPEAYVLGVTATPERLDGRGLDDTFETLIIGAPVRELIDLGFLAKFKLFAPEKRPDLSAVRIRAGDYEVEDLTRVMTAAEILLPAVDEYRKHCDGERMLVFCASVAASQLTVKHFQTAGYRAAHLDGESPKDERRDVLAKLASGEVQIVSNCSLFGEGVDIPAVRAVMTLRPTQSLAVHLQQIGRALRPAEDKPHAIILDIACNVFRHGMPDLDRNWSLKGRDRKLELAPMKRCPACGFVLPAAVMTCSECGYEFPRPLPPAPRLIKPPRLVEINGVSTRWLAAASYSSVLRWAGRNEIRLRMVAQARGYKTGWIWHRMQEQEQEV